MVHVVKILQSREFQDRDMGLNKNIGNAPRANARPIYFTGKFSSGHLSFREGKKDGEDVLAARGCLLPAKITKNHKSMPGIIVCH
jgi:hypothetical protein